MGVSVHFYSYFKRPDRLRTNLEIVDDGASLADLLKMIFRRFPKLSALEKSMLVAVGVEYQPRNYVFEGGR